MAGPTFTVSAMPAQVTFRQADTRDLDVLVRPHDRVLCESRTAVRPSPSGRGTAARVTRDCYRAVNTATVRAGTVKVPEPASYEADVTTRSVPRACTGCRR